MSHLLTLSSFSEKTILKLIKEARKLKKLRGKKSHPQPLKGKTLAMIFEKSSTRTRVSFEVAMVELGGHPLFISSSDSQISRGESYRDTAEVLSRYVHGILLRTFSQSNLEEMASASKVPVINGLSDQFHPVQLLSDLLTLSEEKGDIKKIKVAYVGDGNNLTNSWIEASRILGFELRVVCPKDFFPTYWSQKELKSSPQIQFFSDPKKGVQGVDVIYTDTWFSMGQKVDVKKKKLFSPFQLNSTLLQKADKDVIVLHCLPAHVGEEITEEVMTGPHSRVWQQAENRLHMQKAILMELLK